MGSLPNLHELGKEQLVQSSHHQKIGPATSNPYQHNIGHSILSQEERNRILHRHSTHCKTKRCTQDAKGRNCDDLVLEHMSTYSPISSRSARNYNMTRRRDSMNSSIGANSVRRLIAVVRNTSSRAGPAFSRPVLIRNLLLICSTHILITATYLPFLALQGSVSAWIRPLDFNLTLNIGSLLLSLMHFMAAIGAILGPIAIQKVGTNCIFVLAYIAFLAFHLTHLYPIPQLLLIVYILMGLCLGTLSVARVTFLMTLSAKLNYIFGEEDEDVKAGRRTCIIRRVARSFQAAQDVGLILGSLLFGIVINVSFKYQTPYFYDNSTLFPLNSSSATENSSLTQQQVLNRYLEDLFIHNGEDRICGAAACPLRDEVIKSNRVVLPEVTSGLLIACNAGMCLIALVLSLFLNKIKLYVYQEGTETMAAVRAIGHSFKDPVLRISSVLAFFIGVEQAFMYTDFSKFYVVCTLGLHRLNLVFVSMGILQSIAACTLSMLLRTIRRYYVIFVGFAFHACLLMVQLLWRPIGDDPALFYVISAAWGVCNAVWEMMNFTLLTSVYTENWEAPFANSLAFRFLGISAAFLFHGYICTWIKLYLMAALLLTAVIPSAILERKLENVRRVRGASRL